MITDVRAPVKVGVVFSGGAVRIRWLIWNEQKVFVTRVTFHWKTHRGGAAIHHFALCDGRMVFEVSFHPAHLTWYLERVHDEDETHYHAC